MSQIEALYQTALTEHRAGRIDSAESLYRQILDQDRLFARAWHLLGVILQQRGDTPTAIEHIQRAISLEPQWPAFYSNLGTIYSSLGRWAEAEAALRQCLTLSPDSALALRALGRVLCERNRCDEAVGVFQRAVAVDSKDAEALGGLAFAYSELGLVEESLASYRRASELSPDPIYRVLATTLLPLVYESAEDVERWRNRLMREVDALLAAGITVNLTDRAATPLFSLAHQGMNDDDILRKVARLYRPPELGGTAGSPSSALPRDATTSNARLDKPAVPHGKIHVGFISSFLCHHTIGKLFRGLITHLSRDEFHVTVFSVGAHDDFISRELAARADRYCLMPRDLPQARKLILDNAVDVLVYTDIGMDQTTYSLAFSRLAPVQCTTWGHPETTGIQTIDYFVSSDLMEAPDADAHYAEKLVRLPGLSLYFYRSELPTNLPGRAQFGLAPDARVYACPQSIYKFHPDFDLAIATILRRDPQAQVVLIRWAYPQADALLRQRLARVMPDVVDRIWFLPRLQQDEFLSFLTTVDVLLDPFPYGGGLSSLEAFSFGVPVVTLPTKLLRGRLTQAFYRRLGVEFCIARDVAEYVEIALRLANERSFRQQVHDLILAGQPRLYEDASAIRDWESFLRSAADR